MKKLVLIMALVLMASPAFAGNIVNTQSDYLIITAKGEEVRIYDLADNTWNTSNASDRVTGGDAWAWSGVHVPAADAIVFGAWGTQDQAFQTDVSDWLANTPSSFSIGSDNGQLTGLYHFGADGNVYTRFAGHGDFVRHDIVTGNGTNVGDPGGVEHFQSHQDFYWNGPEDGANGAMYTVHHGGGITKNEWIGGANPWAAGVSTPHSAGGWTGYNGALDGNGILYGGPGDSPNVRAVDLNDSSIPAWTVCDIPDWGDHQRSIGNHAGSMAVDTEGDTLYVYGYYTDPYVVGNWFGTIDVATNTYTPVYDGGAWFPDLAPQDHHAGQFTYLDLRPAAGPGGVIPEPAGLGLAGLALLGLTRRRRTMKKLAAIMAMVGLVCVLSASADAGSISLNFKSDGNDVATFEMAGLVPKLNWNNLEYASNANNPPSVWGGIVDEDPAATPMGVRATAWDGRPQPVVGADPNARMMEGRGPSPFNSSSDPHLYAAVELTNILASVGASEYDVIIYIGNGIGGNTGSFGNMHLTTHWSNNNGPVPPPGILATKSYATLASPFTGTSGVPVYDPGVGFIDASLGPGNYVLFEGRTEDYLVIQPEMLQSQSNFHGVSIEGIQLIVEGGGPGPGGVIPEPAGLGLVGLALLGLTRKKRAMKKLAALVAMVGLVCVLSAPAGAKIVSINIANVTDISKDVLAGETAGAVPAVNWNNARLSGGGLIPAGVLVDDTGATTTSMSIQQHAGDARPANVSGLVNPDARMYESLAPHVSTDNLPNKNHAFGPGTCTLLDGLLLEFPGGYDVHLYLSMWSFSTGTGGQIVVDDNAGVYGRGYNGHGAPWTGSVANLDYLIDQPRRQLREARGPDEQYAQLPAVSILRPELQFDRHRWHSDRWPAGPASGRRHPRAGRLGAARNRIDRIEKETLLTPLGFLPVRESARAGPERRC